VTAVLERTAGAHPAGAAGAGLVLQVQQRQRRCSDCRSTADETQFRAHKAAYCVECLRRRQAEIDRNRRRVAA
jgi:hypothetical protein